MYYSIPTLAVMIVISHVAAENAELKHILKRKLLNTPLKRNTEQEQESEACFTVQHLQALKEQFSNYIDKNNDGRASFKEVSAYLRKYNPDVSEEKIRDFMARRDKDGDGSVDFIPDYLLEISAPDYDLQTAREWFELEDTNGDGVITADELINIAMSVGMSRKEAKQTANGYYMRADSNGDGQLSWEEYLPLYSM